MSAADSLSSAINFATIVREARTSRGLLQREVADFASVSAQAVLDLEAGKGTLATLFPILDALNVRLAGLPIGNTVAARIKRARAGRHMSINALAERAGLSKDTVMRLERGTGRVVSLEPVLSILAPKTRRRAPDIGFWRGNKTDRRFTPPEMFAKLEEVFGRFNLDPCADPESPIKTPLQFTEEINGLLQPWEGATFVNPPYSAASKFLIKGFNEWMAGRCTLVVLLLRVRCYGNPFHDIIAPFADTFFLRRQVSFLLPDGSRAAVPLGHMVVVFGADAEMATRMMATLECSRLPPTHHLPAHDMIRKPA
jgi:transcriptional regulator with XRE-family HTH domain